MKKFFSALICVSALSAWAAVTVPAIFSDHAVLAKRNGVPIFGTAAPGEKVRLTFAGQTASAVAGRDGRWMIKLNLADTGCGPHVLKINNLTFKDILVGEVFLASGQSNMAFRLNRAEGYYKEKSLPANKFLRCFNVTPNSQKKPVADVKGRWVIAAPESLKDFSAAGYFFGKDLQKTLQVPIGIINSSVGGTEIECWMSQAGLANFPNAVEAGKKRELLYESYPRRYLEFLKKNRAWEKRFQRVDDFAALPPVDAVWKKAVPPVAFGNGIYFLRTKVKISAADAARGFRINLMRSYAPVELFIDGKRYAVRKDDSAYKQGYFTCNIRKKQLSAGTHEVILRYFVSHDRVRLPRVVYFGNAAVSERVWDIYCGKDFGKPDAAELKMRPRLPGLMPSRNRLWSRLFNGMINPLIPYRLSGVIWYQGESNARDAAAYRKLFPALIRDWRKHFENEELPFFFCQLAAFNDKSADPAKHGTWPLLRDAQRAALQLPATGMVVLTDAGEARDIHPVDKKTPGSRLAKLALKQIYGHKIIASGPVVKSVTADKSTVIVEFSECADGLKIKPLPGKHPLKRTGKQYEKLLRNSPHAQVEGFALCGSSGKWFWADKAEIHGTKVVVSSGKVPVPVKIRFGWMDNPSCNLYNQAGLPAVPFELPVTAIVK